MKKQILLFTLLLTALVVQAQQDAPHLMITAKDGDYAVYFYDDIQKISFSDNNMIVFMKQGESNTFAISNINKLHFEKGGGYVQQEKVESFFVWAPLTKELSVRCPAGTAIRVYSPNGRLAITAIQSVTQAPVNLSTLPKGTYVIEAASKTSKIVIR